MSRIAAIWAGLSTMPLLWLAVTVAIFAGVDALFRRSGRHPLLHPVLLATPLIILLLKASGTPYPVYAAGTQFLIFLLGPAVVALAVPLWRNRESVRRAFWPIAAALFAGSCTAIISATAILWCFGAPATIIASIAPRAATTPVGIAVARELGGIPSLAAVIVLASGVVGAMIFGPVMRWLRVTDDRARGFAAGVAAHAFGTVRAFQDNEEAGSFASLGMALNAVATALILSLCGLLLG